MTKTLKPEKNTIRTPVLANLSMALGPYQPLSNQIKALIRKIRLNRAIITPRVILNISPYRPLMALIIKIATKTKLNISLGGRLRAPYGAKALVPHLPF